MAKERLKKPTPSDPNRGLADRAFVVIQATEHCITAAEVAKKLGVNINSAGTALAFLRRKQLAWPIEREGKSHWFQWNHPLAVAHRESRTPPTLPPPPPPQLVPAPRHIKVGSPPYCPPPPPPMRPGADVAYRLPSMLFRKD